MLRASIAVIDPKKGKVILPILGDFRWAKNKGEIQFLEQNIFENCYRDVVEMVFGSERVAKKYGRIISTRMNKQRREQQLQRNLQDLDRFQRIVKG